MNPLKPHSLNVPTSAAASLVFESATCIMIDLLNWVGVKILNKSTSQVVAMYMYILYRLYYRPTCIRVLTTSAGWVTRLAMIPAPVSSGFTTALHCFIVDIREIHTKAS